MIAGRDIGEIHSVLLLVAPQAQISLVSGVGIEPTTT